MCTVSFEEPTYVISEDAGYLTNTIFLVKECNVTTELNIIVTINVFIVTAKRGSSSL